MRHILSSGYFLSFEAQSFSTCVLLVMMLFFIINNQEEQANVLLPSNLQNDYQFCVNCNHDLYFKEQLILEPYEFYIISDAK